MREREELLGTAKRTATNSDGVSRRTDLYLKEHDHLRKYIKIVIKLYYCYYDDNIIL